MARNDSNFPVVIPIGTELGDVNPYAFERCQLASRDIADLAIRTPNHDVPLPASERTPIIDRHVIPSGLEHVLKAGQRCYSTASIVARY